jgi:hypothetical protein
MTFAQIPVGTTVFLDANSLVYHFTNDPKYGLACTQLVQGVEQGSALIGPKQVGVSHPARRRISPAPPVTRMA